MNRWQVLATDSANTRWVIRFRSHQVAHITWSEDIDWPMRALECIRDGLNGERGPRQPGRCWAFGDQRADGHPILHNGHEMGTIVWAHYPPCEDPDRWQHQILAGLNYVDERRGIHPPAPAPPRHLRAVC